MSDIVEHRRKASQTLGAYCLPGPEMIALLDEIERLRKDKLHWEHQNGLLEAKIERLRALVQDMLENDPNDDAADGVTVLQVWRKEARRMLEAK